ncbi:MAG: ABC transporter permease [Chloroflexi bacterium]|nr:ABC transporter permease [Chloroflexota bacterium]
MSVPRLLNRAAFILAPVALSLIITAVLIAALGNDPLEVFDMTWTGAFRDSARVAAVLNLWIPLTLCAIGLIVTFTAGLWNIGVEGQMMAGGAHSQLGRAVSQLAPARADPGVRRAGGVGRPQPGGAGRTAQDTFRGQRNLRRRRA